jgi:hypothetical protein
MPAPVDAEPRSIAKERLIGQQKYDREVAAENVKLAENDTKRGEIDAKRQGIGQQLKVQLASRSLSPTASEAMRGMRVSPRFHPTANRQS